MRTKVNGVLQPSDVMTRIVWELLVLDFQDDRQHANFANEKTLKGDNYFQVFLSRARIASQRAYTSADSSAYTMGF